VEGTEITSDLVVYFAAYPYISVLYRKHADPGTCSRTYVSAAMRLCVELGFHRKQRRRPPSVEYEIDKRRFWTAYALDREISISIGLALVLLLHGSDHTVNSLADSASSGAGRPMSILDRDIDVDVSVLRCHFAAN